MIIIVYRAYIHKVFYYNVSSRTLYYSIVWYTMSTAGYARFYPYFGLPNTSLPIYIDDVQCVGTEPRLSACKRQTEWRQHNCQHAEDAGVQCIVNQDDGQYTLCHHIVHIRETSP